MTHPLVTQLQFAKQKWLAGHAGLSATDGAKRVANANSISWMVGHLAHYDQFTWCEVAQGLTISEDVKRCASGKPASTPDLDQILADWHDIQRVANIYLEQLTADDLDTHLTLADGRPLRESIGTLLCRHTWHYWYHLGEMQGLRQALGHEDLPQYVGAIEPQAAYQPNAAKRLVADMVDGLNRHEVVQMTDYWDEAMHWYGPVGIGDKLSLKAFQEEHQHPFLHAFPDKQAFDEIRIAEGEYVAAKGYQQVTHLGDYLGIPASGKPMQIRYMDFWRAENGKLVENWVMIDLLHFLEQAGYNVENVLRFIGSKPPEFFNPE